MNKKFMNITKLFLVVSMFLVALTFISGVRLPRDSETNWDDDGNYGIETWLLVQHDLNGSIKNNSINDKMLNLTNITISDFTNDANYLVTVGNVNIDLGEITADRLNLTDITLNDFVNDRTDLFGGDNFSSITITESQISDLSHTTDTQLSESEVEAFVFDNDNTADLVTTGDITSGAILVNSQTAQALKAEYNINESQGAWVHGVKVELTRTADIQPATDAWFGGQFVLNAGSSGYTSLDKPAYALQAIFKGSDTTPNGVDIHVARFETQSNAKVSDILYVTANSGTTLQGSGIYIANHGTMPQAIQINGAGGTLTDGIDMLGTIVDYGIDMGSATIGKEDIRLSGGPTITSGDGAPSGSGAKGSLYTDYTNGKLYINTDGSTTWVVVGTQT